MAKKEKVKEPKAPKAEGSKGNLLKIVIIVLLSLILIGGAVLGGYLLAGKKSSSGNEVKTEKNERKKLLVFALENATVNLADEGGKRYAKVKVSLGYEENSKLAAELEASKDIVSDSVISVLRSKKTTEIDSSHEKLLKDAIKEKVNSVLLNGQIEEVYFVEILVQ